MSRRFIVVEGARQNNLKNVSVEVPVGAVTAVTGVAGAGKSSLAFDVLYAEGYRRYVETFSPYARQFLERLDRPRVERIEGVLPSIAIDQTAPVRTSRSTVGTMTSVADYLRALFARSSTLHCDGCGEPVERSSPSGIFEHLLGAADGRGALVCFEVVVGEAEPAAVRELLAQAAFRRVLEDGRAVPLEEARLEAAGGKLTVVLDRLTLAREGRQRIIDSLEAALRYGKGQVELRVDGLAEPLRYSERLHCARCDLAYSDPTAAQFSFNNPVGACETCKGFGRTIDLDPDLIVPDPRKTIAQGCIRPFQTPAYLESQDDLMRFFKRAGLDPHQPWATLDRKTLDLVWDGEPGAGGGNWQTLWYGIRGFFKWQESRSYKMHVRVFLSRFRRYLPCPDCGGARLKPAAQRFRLGGRTLAELEAMPLSEAQAHFAAWTPPKGDIAAQLLLREIRGRLQFLLDTGLGYLSLGRQSRTLSGGESQRVTLATALGSSLTSTLYVLDEPSVGLHPRDAGRLGGVLRRLAEAGNAVVVVEHDRELIAVADHVIDLGPGPGHLGGEVVYQGPLDGLMRAPGSRTGDFLAGRLSMPAPAERRRPLPGRRLRVVGARENNLAGLTLELPLGLFVCVTGVSGSGKSTLVDQVLYRNLRRNLGQSEAEAGACEAVEGTEQLSAVTLVDQSPLGRSSKVNAATYLGALAPLRTAFAATPAARERGLTASAFSFNSAAGACPVCEGAGYERLELQFLPDALVKCPACDGRRYRPEVLEVRCRGYSIAELLDLPAERVAQLFADDKKLVKALRPMLDIGLGYLSLSQPAPTLSGGEAQRLKLAACLAEAGEAPNQLFILDEPTTGLHAADVSVLVGALHRLVEAGHSVLVIEHNMELAGSADWIVDLGPEGGDGGGRVVGEGTPETIAGLSTHTGEALRRAMTTRKVRPPRRTAREMRALEAARSGEGAIQILGASENNLQHVHAALPRDRLIAVTGVSGSGKSTLAFDVLYAEGQRRFLDCLPAYARQFIRPLARPDVDRLEGVPPTVALEQKLTRGTPLSTAGTASEVYHYLRLLFAFLGVAHCPECGVPGEASAAVDLARRIAEHFPEGEILVLAPLVSRRKGFHKDVLEAAAKRGVAEVRIDGVIHDAATPPRLDRFRIHDIEAVVARLALGGTARAGKTKAASDSAPRRSKGVRKTAVRADGTHGKVPRAAEAATGLRASRRSVPSARAAAGGLDGAIAAEREGGYAVSTEAQATVAGAGLGAREAVARLVDLPGRVSAVTGPALSEPLGELSEAIARALELGGGTLIVSARGHEDRLYSTRRSCPSCGAGLPVPDPRLFTFSQKFGACPECEGLGVDPATRETEDPEPCEDCRGTRLRPEALAVRIGGLSIGELASRSVHEVDEWVSGLLRGALPPEVLERIVPELQVRLGMLERLGLGYLTLDRGTDTLSTGEAQRIRIVAALASSLGGVCYVLDEPTVGLHPRDSAALAKALFGLRDRGNTVVVVEHDETLIRSADHLVDLGPGAGPHGGRIVAQGSPAAVARAPESLTGRWLRGDGERPVWRRRPLDGAARLTLTGASLHNLREVKLELPLGRLVAVTGVSGSGKSTLVREALHRSVKARLAREPLPPFVRGLEGVEHLRRALQVDESPIGRTPRSVPATYIGIMNAIRGLFAASPEARARGYDAARFSFNVAGGRCERCEGQGRLRVSMSLLPEVYIPCEGCGGRRYNADTLQVLLKGRSIADVLAMTVEEAREFFAAFGAVRRPLDFLAELGLSYLQLGQASPTLSGGEAQRIKLAAELASPGFGPSLYVLDEPTTGLHMADVSKLVGALQRLVDRGDTVVMIEHNLDVMAAADCVIDLGPEGGVDGGRIVAWGAPEDVVRVRESRTAAYLAEALGQGAGRARARTGAGRGR